MDFSKGMKDIKPMHIHNSCVDTKLRTELRVKLKIFLLRLHWYKSEIKYNETAIPE